MHFERLAELYERARPPYPDALWRRLAALGVLEPGHRALDLGAGTGQATGPLVAAGLDVTAVEPGVRLAELVGARFPQARVIRSTVEEADIPARSFDLAVAATSVHWFDLDVALPKIRRALTPGGTFAVWRNAFGDPSAPVTPFRERVQEIVSRRDAPPRPGLGESQTEEWASRLEAGGHFEVEWTEEFRWSITLDDRQIRELFTTISDWSAVEAEQASEAVRELGGSVTEDYVTPLIVLRPV